MRRRDSHAPPRRLSSIRAESFTYQVQNWTISTISWYAQ